MEWEYKVIELPMGNKNPKPLEEALNRFGKEGWEYSFSYGYVIGGLCPVDMAHHIFKRQKASG